MKKKSTEKPKLPKEYVWTLDYDGVEKIFKCVVTETMCTTYEGDVEHKHLKIMNPECKEGVLQIDTVTSIYGEQVSFQLERFIPYIMLEDGWTMSDTTREDRLQAQIKQYKKQSLAMCCMGVAFLVYTLVDYLIHGTLGEWPMAPALGIFCLAAAATTMIRLKNEVEAMGREFSWKL